MKLLLVIVPAVLLICLAPLCAEAKTYENDKYSFEFPNGCKLEKKENRFSTANAILDCKGDAGLQFESSADLSDSIALASDDTLVDTMENVFERLYENVNIVETGTDKYMINNLTAPYVLGTYDQEFSNAFGFSSTKPYVLMGMIIKLNSDDVILVQYRNNEDDFDKGLPMAEKIFQSVKGLGKGTKTETDNSFTKQGDDLPKTKALCDTVTTESAKDLCETLLT